MKKQRIYTIIILLIIIPLGFYTKLYTGPGHEWINNKLGGVFYEIFWCLLFFIILPNIKPIKIALWVYIITCILEFIQLFSNSFFEIIRTNYIGQTIVGNSFSWSDFPYYFVGSCCGFLILSLIKRIQ